MFQNAQESIRSLCHWIQLRLFQYLLKPLFYQESKGRSELIVSPEYEDIMGGDILNLQGQDLHRLNPECQKGRCGIPLQKNVRLGGGFHFKVINIRKEGETCR